jgi:hypothetical protein
MPKEIHFLHQVNLGLVMAFLNLRSHLKVVINRVELKIQMVLGKVGKIKMAMYGCQLVVKLITVGIIGMCKLPLGRDKEEVSIEMYIQEVVFDEKYSNN